MSVSFSVFHHLRQNGEAARTRGCKNERERDRNERNAESFGVLGSLGDDMRGNERSDFIHQKRDAPHRLDCQRVLPRIGEMRAPIISFRPLHTSF